MSNIQSFRTPKRTPHKRPPKKEHTGQAATEVQKDTDKGDFVGGIGEVTPDARSMREVPSIIRTDTATRHERSLSSGPYPHLERSSSTAEVAQNSIATGYYGPGTIKASTAGE